MNEFTFVAVIARPVMRPSNAPKASPPMIPATSPTVLIALTVMMADAVATAAIERSKTPAMMHSVVVDAKIKRMDDCSRMFAALSNDRNDDGDAKANSTKSTPKTPGSRQSRRMRL